MTIDLTQLSALDLPPLQSARGAVRLPGSKSISNRALLLAALAAGTTRLHGLLASDDTAVMIAALQQLGVKIEQTSDFCRITSLGAKAWKTETQLFLGNAGTAMRPLVAALAFVATTQTAASYQLSGTARMHERPIGDLVDALVAGGCAIDYIGQKGYPPLHISTPPALPATPGLANHWSVRGDVSSQFLTALLMSAPLLASAQAISVQVQGLLISRPYIDITLKLMAAFGVTVQVDTRDPLALRYTIPAGSRYHAIDDYAIEPDASSASYFLALAALASTEGLTLEGLGRDSMQGDIAFSAAVQAMGAEVDMTADRITVKRGAWPLKAFVGDCNAMPDAAMTLAVMALFADGPSTLRNIASWRVKETDRLHAMRVELEKCGAQVVEGADTLTVYPLARADWRSAAIRTYDDHRMAMCFALTALNPAQKVMRILDPGCVAKTFPHYFDTLFKVAQSAPQHIPVITIDGPSASGKGTLALALAQALGYHYLDSGSLYRALAWAALDDPVAMQNAAALQELMGCLQPSCADNGVSVVWGTTRRLLQEELRSEAVGQAASQLAALPAVRSALLEVQRQQRRLPGLVCDGRDMGTVVFPDAALKIHLIASAATRAQRRVVQLQSRGAAADYAQILADLEARDARDRNRSTAPLQAAVDAVDLDNSNLNKEQALAQVLALWTKRRNA